MFARRCRKLCGPLATALRARLPTARLSLNLSVPAAPTAPAALAPALSAASPRKIRNVAIIAHVDHGKTTLVDALLRESNFSLKNDCALDTGELEREKGITIVAKVTSIAYRQHVINIVDTPGHQDFGGQVERALSLVDGVLLVVCATEGIMRQTRFVLEKALARGLRPLVFVNKVDRDSANVAETENAVFDLFCSMTQCEQTLEYATLYGSGKAGFATRDKARLPARPSGMAELLDAVLELVPPPQAGFDAARDFLKAPDLLMQVTQVERDPFFGKGVRGKIERGKAMPGTAVRVFAPDGTPKGQGTLSRVTKAVGLAPAVLQEAVAGDIVAVWGVERAALGDLLVAGEAPASFADRQQVLEPPLLSVEITANNSPFVGKNGATRNSFAEILRALEEEVERDPALRLEREGQRVRLFGRGDLHIGLLLERLRREGFELEVGAPRTETRTDAKGQVLEPVEEVRVDVGVERVPLLLEKLIARKADVKDTISLGESYQRVVARLPARLTLGLHAELVAETNCDVKYESALVGYEPVRGSLKKSRKPALLCSTTGTVTQYGMRDLDRWGQFFVKPGQQVFAGQVIGVALDREMVLNPCKEKHVSNVRVVEREEKLTLGFVREFSVEEALGFADAEELIELSPAGIRLRKKEVSADSRKRMRKDGN